MMAGMITDSTTQQRHALTEGAARRIFEDLYERGEERVTMQVIDLAKVKYQQPVSGIEFTSPCQFENPIHLARNDKPVPSCPRYRLVVSDGQNLVPAKFYPERLDIKTDHLVPDKIHALVQNGELKKGCIISFNPNCHVSTGSGIVTMFSMRIEGHSELIMAEGVETLRPLHNETMAFSPKNVHECTLPLDFDHDAQDPLPRSVLRLAKVTEDVFGYCTIAGGAVLAKYLYDLPGCANCYERFYSSDIARICAKSTCKDIDLFVPLYPSKLDKFYHGEEVDKKRTDPFTDLLDRSLDELFQKYGLQHTPVQREKIELSGVTEGGQDYGWMRIFVGLKEKLEFQLIAPYGKVIERPIQILVMDAMPESVNEPWRDVVVKGFDADVIKAVAVIDDKACLEKVLFSSDNQEENLKLHNSLLSGTFNYTMRPCHSFPRMMERLDKYKKRGFELASFQFDFRVSDEWRDHILTEFTESVSFVFSALLKCHTTVLTLLVGISRYVYSLDAPHWIKEMLSTTVPNFSTHILVESIMPFLLENPNRPELEIRWERRGMLRKMIRMELQRTNQVDPGHNKVNMVLLEWAWRRHDRRELGLPGEEFPFQELEMDENAFAPLGWNADDEEIEIEMDLDDSEEEGGGEEANEEAGI